MGLVEAAVAAERQKSTAVQVVFEVDGDAVCDVDAVLRIGEQAQRR